MINSIELFGCEMETDNIYGLNWPNTKTGELAIVKCSPTIANNVATRLCNNNNIWDKINVTNCESFQYSLLLFEVRTSLSYGLVAKVEGPWTFLNFNYIRLSIGI